MLATMPELGGKNVVGTFSDFIIASLAFRGG